MTMFCGRHYDEHRVRRYDPSSISLSLADASNRLKTEVTAEPF